MNRLTNNTCDYCLGNSRPYDFMDRWLRSLDHQPQILRLVDPQGDAEAEIVTRITVIQVIEYTLLHVLRDDEDDNHQPTNVADTVFDAASGNMDANDDRDAHETPTCNSPIAPRRKATTDATAFTSCPTTVEDLESKKMSTHRGHDNL